MDKDMLNSEEYLDYLYGNVDESCGMDDDDDDRLIEFSNRAEDQLEWMKNYLQDLKNKE